ncbi:MAG: hypothetical protein VX360_05805 [Actinomycetota bacterium]|nr:hypothetical protein [Actinomycetota bacterium]MED5361787.1 hypothetical protein [Actinomycetota bacterium]
MDNLSDKNRQRAGAVTAFFGLSVLMLSGIMFLVLVVVSLTTWVALGIALLMALSLLWASKTSERRILEKLPGTQLGEGEQPRLINLVEGLCLSTGISPPRIHILPTEGRNIAALGRSVDHSTLIVTSGLLGAATRIELEAVLANRISQIASYRTALATTAITTFGLSIELLSFRIRPFSFLTGSAKRKIGLQVDASHDFAGDVAGTGITRYPPGMVEAIEMMENRTSVPEVSSTLDSLWLFPSTSNTNRPTVEARATALREM